VFCEETARALPRQELSAGNGDSQAANSNELETNALSDAF